MRIAQLRKVILTSSSVDENKGDESRPASPMKVDFDHSPYQVHRLLMFCNSCSDVDDTRDPTVATRAPCRTP
jgi:hypothetical protein